MASAIRLASAAFSILASAICSQATLVRSAARVEWPCCMRRAPIGPVRSAFRALHDKLARGRYHPMQGAPTLCTLESPPGFLDPLSARSSTCTHDVTEPHTGPDTKTDLWTPGSCLNMRKCGAFATRRYQKLAWCVRLVPTSARSKRRHMRGTASPSSTCPHTLAGPAPLPNTRQHVRAPGQPRGTSHAQGRRGEALEAPAHYSSDRDQDRRSPRQLRENQISWRLYDSAAVVAVHPQRAALDR